MLAAACGGYDEAPVDGTPLDAAPVPDASFVVVCGDGQPVTITGMTPRGAVDGLAHLNVLAQGGFCAPRIQLVFTAQPEFGYPEPTPRLSVQIDVPDLLDTPLSGDFAAAVEHHDDAGVVEATGTFSADAIDPLGGPGPAGIRGRLVVDDPGAGWALDLVVDALYCLADTCP